MKFVTSTDICYTTNGTRTKRRFHIFHNQFSWTPSLQGGSLTSGQVTDKHKTLQAQHSKVQQAAQSGCFLKKRGVHMLKGNTKNKKRKKHNTKQHQLINPWLQHWHNERMSEMALNSQLKRDSYRKGKERVQWQCQQHLWNIRWRKVQETKVSHWTKATSCEGEARHRVCDTKSYTDAICQNYFQLYKIVSSATKHLELTVLKQKQTVRKQQLHYKDVQALFTGYTATGDHNKPQNCQCDWITFTIYRWWGASVKFHATQR